MTDPQFDTNSAATGESAAEALSPEGLGLDAATDAATADVSEETTADRGAELEALVSERTADLQRLQAEYANYKKRVDRDRDLARQSGVESVLRDFMPVLDSIELARQHDDLSDGFSLRFTRIPTGRTTQQYSNKEGDKYEMGNACRGPVGLGGQREWSLGSKRRNGQDRLD